MLYEYRIETDGACLLRRFVKNVISAFIHQYRVNFQHTNQFYHIVDFLKLDGEL